MQKTQTFHDIIGILDTKKNGKDTKNIFQYFFLWDTIKAQILFVFQALILITLSKLFIMPH